MTEVERIIWGDNAERGRVEEMYRLSCRNGLRIPFPALNRAVVRLMLFLHKAKCDRWMSDIRSEAQLLEELGFAFVLLSEPTRKDMLLSRELRDELVQELEQRQALTAIARAQATVNPSEEITSDSASATANTSISSLFDAPDPLTVRIRVPSSR